MMLSLLLLLMLTTGLVQCESSLPDSECSETAAFTSQLTTCTTLAENWIIDYALSLDRGEEDFFLHLCSEFRSVSACFLNLTCTERVRHLLPWWENVSAYGEYKCDVKQLTTLQAESSAVSEMVDGGETCFERENSKTYAYYCSYYYLPQDRRANCNELMSSIECTAKLVATSCGDVEASYARAVRTGELWSQLSDQGCSSKAAKVDPDMFGYNKKCPKKIAKRLLRCRNKYLPKLETTDGNDFILNESAESLRHKCWQFQNYTSCMSRPQRLCPQGVDVYYRSETVTHARVQLLERICHPDTLEDYLASLSCYKHVEKRRILRATCPHASQQWGRLDGSVLLSDFYCSGSTQVMQFKKLLASVRSCWSFAVQHHCGQRAADIMDTLYTLWFTDSHYLFAIYYDRGDWPIVPYCGGRDYDKSWSDDLFTQHYSQYSDNELARPPWRGNGEYVQSDYYRLAHANGPFFYNMNPLPGPYKPDDWSLTSGGGAATPGQAPQTLALTSDAQEGVTQTMASSSAVTSRASLSDVIIVCSLVLYLLLSHTR